MGQMIVDKYLQRIILFLVSIAAFLIPFMGSSLNLALPVIQSDLSVNIILLGWIPTAFVLATAAFVLPFGRLADIVGRRKIFAYGIIVYTLSSLVAAFSFSGEMLILFSFMQGLGCAMIFSTMVALLSSVFPMERRGEALGLYVTAVFIGLFLGPILGGFIIQYLGWRAIFLFNVPIGVVLLFVLFWKLKVDWTEASNEKFDIKGTLIYIISLIALLYGFSSLQDDFGIYLLLVGLLGILLFIYIEKRSTYPLLKLEIFKQRKTSLAAIAMLLLNTAISAMATLLSIYLQEPKGLQPEYAALILAVQPLMVALLSPLVGRASDRADHKFFPIYGLILVVCGLVLLAFLGGDTPLIAPVLALFIIGIGQALFSTPVNRTFMGSVESKIYGMASSAFSTMIYLGQTFSLGILVFIFSIFLGKVEISPSNYPIFLLSLQTAFIIFAIIAAGSLICYIFLVKSNNST
jgi:EmrB/QacA subfamily drug resistance transporter